VLFLLVRFREGKAGKGQQDSQQNGETPWTIYKAESLQKLPPANLS
jgi:hypothetical protein